MSVPNQPNGKKSASSSLANTPSSTPVTSSNGNTPAVTVIHNSPPPNNNAPKYGTLVPNRIFVGGISANTTEGELLQLFSTYGTVKAAKIIQDRAGVSKGYGFITFESEDDAQRPLREADNIVLRERKLNIAPAVKKQPFNFNRAFDGASPTTVTVAANPSFFLPPIPYYQNSMSYYGPPAPNAPVPGDPNAQQQVYQPPPPVYSAQTGPPQAATFPPSVMYPQPFYIQQQYPLMPYTTPEFYFSNNGAPAQYVVGAQGGPGPQGPPLPPSGSPPRPPCFNQQVAYANEPVYYNLPMYQPVEHPAAIFQDPIDANGNYSDRPNSVQSASAVDVYNSHAGTEIVERPRLLLPSVSPFDAAATRFASPTPPFMNLPPPTVPRQPQRETEETARQTATPEVSLLSIDNSCERDLNSMQGGRRRPAPSTIPPSSAYHPIPNGLPPLAVSLANTSVPPPSHFRYQQPPFYSQVPLRPLNGQGSQFVPNGRQQQLVRSAQANTSWPRRPGPKRNYVHRTQQNNNTSTRSSVRTESTSSLASVIEDNRNNQRTNVNTPPPAPYSPLTNHGYAPRFIGTTTPPVDTAPARQNRHYNNLNGQQHDNRRLFNNRSNNYNKQNGSNYRTNNVRQNGHNGFVTNNNRRGAFRQTELTNNGQQANRFRPEANRTVAAALPENGHRVETNESELTESSDRVDIKPENENNDDTNAPQVHGASGTSSYAPMPIRRSKRSIRRSNAGAGNALSEIGAGDAPLPTQTSESVAEACKKLDGLKL